jgi:transcription initiation factor TFIIIB Brf1 subunit/transcription initiation factor TFIIB
MISVKSIKTAPTIRRKSTKGIILNDPFEEEYKEQQKEVKPEVKPIDEWAFLAEELTTVEVDSELTTHKVDVSRIPVFINMDIEEKPKFEIINSVNVCDSCGSKLLRNRDILICEACGVEQKSSVNLADEQYSSTATTGCNVSEDVFMSMKIVGGAAAKNANRKLIEACANSHRHATFTNSKFLNQLNNNNSSGIYIHTNVLKSANEMFTTIRSKGHVYRKDVRLGVQSACIYYACYQHKISKTPKEIAAYMGIEEKFHSIGDRILHSLNEAGVIEIPSKIDPIDDYIERYLDELKISKIYKGFVLDLVRCAERKNIHIMQDSKNNTKCVGAIYMLVDRVPELRKKITKEMIENACGISKTTFQRYYDSLCKYHKHIRNVFKRHRIPMKRAWKPLLESIKEIN